MYTSEIKAQTHTTAQIEAAVVVELGKGLVQHAGVARTLLRAASGNRSLPVTVLPVRWRKQAAGARKAQR